MKKYTLLAVFSILMLNVFAQDWTKLDQYFEALDKNQKFMGTLAIAQNGKTIYFKAVGFADVETKKKADTNTHYRIGSITKTFTSTLALKAAENFKINLDIPIKKYFPTLPNAEKITIRQLLQHRSGIANFTASADYLKWSTTPKTKQEMYDIILKGGSNFEPGSKFEYSNSNYFLIGIILESAYHRTLEQLINTFILEPLGMMHTKVGGTIDINDNDANSYTFAKSWKKENATDMSIPGAAGNIVSTPEDLNIFSEALFKGKLINEKSLQEMKSLQDNYGLGITSIPFYEHQAYGHNGGIDGFQSSFGYFEKENLAIALTSNSGNFSIINPIMVAALSTFFKKPFEIPDFKTTELSEKELQVFAGNYSSDELPIKMSVFVKEKQLFAQATGQSSFPLTAKTKNSFTFEPAGIEMKFDSEKNEMILKQGGKEFKFKK